MHNTQFYWTTKQLIHYPGDDNYYTIDFTYSQTVNMKHTLYLSKIANYKLYTNFRHDKTIII